MQDKIIKMNGLMVEAKAIEWQMKSMELENKEKVSDKDGLTHCSEDFLCLTEVLFTIAKELKELSQE